MKSFSRWSLINLTFVVPVLLLFPMISQAGDANNQDGDDLNNAGRKFAPGRVIVKYRQGVRLENIAGVFQKNNLRGKQVLSRKKRIELVELPEGKSVKQMIKDLRKNPEVEYAEPDYLIKLNMVPNDPQFNTLNKLWGLHNEGTSYLPADVDIDAPEGWDIRNSAGNVIVAVIDTGIDVTHEDLAANMWHNPNESVNGIDDDGNGYIDDIYGINAIKDITDKNAGNPKDDHGHGSHCAGTIGGVGNNGIGVVGVCWNVQLMALKFLDSSGSGYSSDAIKCFEYAIAKGANVISCSWGGDGFTQSMYDVLTECRNNGIIVVCAAGNNGTNNDIIPHYPSNFPLDNIVAVGASNISGSEASFSCTGLGTVDVFAPGEGIYSCYKDGRYTTMSGTSMATPHVAGVLALMKTHYPGDTSFQLINRLYSSTVPYKLNECKAKGMVNLFNALSNPPNTPINDNFANPVVLRSDLKANMDCTNVGASKENGEPNHAGNPGGNSVWIFWKASISGKVIVTTEESNFDTLLAVYTGSSVSNLTLIAENDDISATIPKSRVEFNAVAGTKYRIAVDGKDGTQGAVALRISCPPVNDNFADRIFLGSELLYADITGDNVGAGREEGEPAHAGQLVGSSIWYSWKSSSKRLCRISLEGSNFDTVMAVYKGDSLSNLELVASNDDLKLYEITYSEVEFVTEPGVEYAIAVDGWGNHVGQSVLRVDASVNQKPEVSFEAYAKTADKLEITLDAAKSFDLEGEIAEYLWTLDDGSIQFGKTITRRFPSFGHFPIQLKVTDAEGLSAIKTEVLVINPQGVVPTDLLCHLNFNEGSGDIAPDASQNGNNGTLYGKNDGPLPEWVTALNGNALKFSGLNYIKILKFKWTANADGLTSTASISSWINSEQAAADKYAPYIMDYGTKGLNLQFQKENLITLSCNVFDPISSTVSVVQLSAEMPSLNEWHHIAGVLDTDVQNGMKLYVDGEMVAQKDLQGLKLSLPATVSYIGTGGGRNSTNYFVGAIDEVGMYAKALNQHDIQYLADNGQVVTFPVGDPGPSDSPDTTAPTVPQNLAASAISSSQINLSWAASSDPVVAGQIRSGVAGYEIRRNGQKIATSATTSYSDKGLSPDTTYSYTVAAFDRANNLSANSVAASAKTGSVAPAPDTTAPTVPQSLAALVISSSQINLSWAASTDPVVAGQVTSGVAGYEIRRDGQKIATATGTSYSDTGLSPSTVYSYTVAAFDAANNTSAASSTVSGTTMGTGINRPSVSLAANDPVASEPNAAVNKGRGKFKIERTGDTNSDLVVNYTMGGTALNGTDYELLSGSVTVPVGQTYVTVAIIPLSDALDENDETVIMTLSDNLAYAVDQERKTGTVTLTDAEYTSPIVNVKILDDTASEPAAADAQGSAKFIVFRTGSLGLPLEVKYTLTGTATNGEDYVSCSGTLTILEGRDRAVLKIRALDDTLTEGTETVQMNLTIDSSYQIDPAQQSATVSIIDAAPAN